MNLADLGKRFIHAAQQHGKSILIEFAGELQKDRPGWRDLGKNCMYQVGELGRDLSDQMRSWVLIELNLMDFNWQNLLLDPSELEKSYELLGLPYGEDLSTVKSKWRSLMKQHHPDQFMSDPALYHQATETTKKLTAAYQVILKMQGN